MEYLILPLLSEVTTRKIVDLLLSDEEAWQDGKITAGSYASQIKNNLQLDRDSDIAIEVGNQIQESLKNNQLIKSFSLPHKYHGLMFTKTGSGQGYGMHLDNPYMSSGRSDLSFTVFLNDKNSYEGGELCIQNMQDEEKIKLQSGDIIIYPSTSLHAVEEVTKGERIVCVGWIQSYIKSNEDRNNLFYIDAGAKKLLAEHGKSPELDLIFQGYSNLLRRLGD